MMRDKKRDGYGWGEMCAERRREEEEGLHNLGSNDWSGDLRGGNGKKAANPTRQLKLCLS